MGAFKPTMPIDEDEEEEFYPGTLDSTDMASNHTVLTEVDSPDKGWRKIENADSTENLVQSTFVNEEAIYVNSTFKGE